MNFKDLFLSVFSYRLVFTAFAHLKHGSHEFDLTSCYFAKFALFFFILTKLKLRRQGRPFLSSLILSNYSEFGLIVVALSCDKWMVEKEWFGGVSAGEVSFSFVITSWVVVIAMFHTWYHKKQRKSFVVWRHRLLQKTFLFQAGEYWISRLVGLGRGRAVARLSSLKPYRMGTVAGHGRATEIV